MNYTAFTKLLLITSLPYTLFSAPEAPAATQKDPTATSTKKVKEKEAIKTPETKHSNKKKIVIFFSKGGGGHLAARDCLKALLDNEYEISKINPLQDLLGSIDPIKTLTFGKLDGEDFFNKIQTNRWIGFGNWSYKHIVPTLILSRRKTVEKKITEYLKKEQPDLLLSVIPCLNLAFANAAQACNIPFLLVTTDCDLTAFTLGLHKITHPNYAITVCKGLDLPKDQLKSRKIPDERVHAIGFVTRHDFFTSHNKETIRKEWNIPKKKFTILLLMGGAGSYSTYQYAKKIASMPLNVHVLVCTGRNEAIADKVRKLKCSPGVSLTVVPFTKKIADLMAVSDLFITKPGPGSVNEAIQMKLPMIVDNTSPVMFWETPNIKMVEANGWGTSLSNFKDLEPKIKKFIDDKKYYAQIKKNLKKAPPYTFDKKLKKIIKGLLKNQTKLAATPTKKDTTKGVAAPTEAQAKKVG
ncbi:MAG: glycosyltransferase [Candidatus Babeliales bacterium]